MRSPFKDVMPDFFDNELVNKAKETYEKIASMSIFQKSPSTRFVVIAFCCVIGVLLCVSGISVIKQGALDNVEETTDVFHTEVSLEATFEQEELVSNCLFILTDNDKQKVHCLALVNLDSEKDSIRLSFINPNEKQSVNNFYGDMNQHLQNGGVNEVVWAVSDKYAITVDRYLSGDESGFTKLMSSFSELTVEIPGQINHSHNGVSFIIESGMQTLTADMMLKYFLYLSSDMSKTANKAVEAMLMYAREIFPEVSEQTDTEKTKERFENILGYFETDISALDYSRYKQAIETLSNGELSSKVTIVDDPANLIIENKEAD